MTVHTLTLAAYWPVVAVLFTPLVRAYVRASDRAADESEN